MKKICYVALAAILAVGCTEKEAEDTLSLSAKEVTLAAAAGEVKTVTVEANNAWTFEQEESAGWLTVQRSDNTLSFRAVGDNKTENEFSTTIKVKAGSKDDAIVVRQLADPEEPVDPVDPVDPVEPERFKVDKTSLSFEGVSEGVSEIINVTLAEGLSFRTDTHDKWIKAKADVEAGTITVTCDNNETDVQRTGTITVTSSDRSLKPIDITVQQEGIFIERHLFVYLVGDETKTPLTEFNTTFHKMTVAEFFAVDLYPFDLSWRIEIVDDGKDYSWLSFGGSEKDDEFFVACAENTSEQDRTATLRIYPIDPEAGGIMPIVEDFSDIKPVEFVVTQTGKPNCLSNLDGDVEAGFAECNALHPVLYTNLDDATLKYSEWSLALCSSDLDWIKNPDSYDYIYSGSGTRFMLTLCVDKYKNGDTKYVIPSGVYNIGSEKAAGVAVAGVKAAWWDYEYCSLESCWYIQQENGSIRKKAPVVSGTVTVSYDEETKVYTFVIDGKDDAGYSIKINWSGVIKGNIERPERH